MNSDRVRFCEAMIVLYEAKLRRGRVVRPAFFRRAIKIYEQEIKDLKGER